jgi:UDP-N-acetylglucosamine 3-dehydrogenase
MRNALTVVIVGAGGMGRTHADAWSQTPNVSIAGVVDVLPERVRELAAKYAIPKTGDDYKAMLDAIKPDIVSVCVQADLHPEVACYAAERKVHVLCEKPIALTTEEAQQMIDTCRAHGVQLGVGFQRRGWGNTVFYKARVEDGDFGQPIYWKRSDIREVRPKLMMHEKRGNGGPIVDCAVHWFDQWRYILGKDPVRVYARGTCFGRGKKRLAEVKDMAPDVGIITVDYAGGSVGEVTMNWGLPEGTASLETEIVMGPEALAFREGKTITMRRGPWVRTEEIETGWLPMMRAFAEAIRNGTPCPTRGEDGLMALKVALAALQSIETGQPVDIA